MKTESFFPIKKYLAGFAAALLITIIVMSLFSVLISLIDLKDSVINTIMRCMKYFSAATVGFFCTYDGKRRGFITGGAAALIYMTALCALGMLIFGNSTPNTAALKQIICGTLCGCFGGIVGINCHKK